MVSLVSTMDAALDKTSSGVSMAVLMGGWSRIWNTMTAWLCTKAIDPGSIEDSTRLLASVWRQTARKTNNVVWMMNNLRITVKQQYDKPNVCCQSLLVFRVQHTRVWHRPACLKFHLSHMIRGLVMWPMFFTTLCVECRRRTNKGGKCTIKYRTKLNKIRGKCRRT